MEGKLFIFCAPSGSGKSTIVQHLVKHESGSGIQYFCNLEKTQTGRA